VKIALSADHRGTHIHRFLLDLVRMLGHEVVGVPTCNGESCDYPDMAYGACRAVVDGRADCAILVCGSGIGMSIAANKIKGIRAAVVHDDIGAELAKSHNDANVICISADMLGERLIETIVRTWLCAEFAGGRHRRRVNKITAIEQGRDPAEVTE
jgi:ribose 5-phosphate isomerase B